MENLHENYAYQSAEQSWGSEYLWPHVIALVRSELPDGGRVFEVGSGNGAFAEALSAMGYEVTGIDPSESGIGLAKAAGIHAKLERASAYDDLAVRYGQFPVVVSLEVVEHCFWPRRFAKTLYELVQPGGIAVISTPYHGYLKNLALALFNKFDSHWSPLWDGGHIKFWSERTLRQLLVEAGFGPIRFIRAGRIAPFAKSMIAVAKRPNAR